MVVGRIVGNAGDDVRGIGAECGGCVRIKKSWVRINRVYIFNEVGIIWQVLNVKYLLLLYVVAC